LCWAQRRRRSFPKPSCGQSAFGAARHGSCGLERIDHGRCGLERIDHGRPPTLPKQKQRDDQAKDRKSDRGRERELNPAVERVQVAGAGMEFTATRAALAADIGERDAERLLNLLADRRLLIRRTAESVSPRPVRAGGFRFLHPMHLELLTDRAPITQQIRSARRLAATSERAARQEA
jgi:hypothetical protein